jgi:tartrate dehydrogenase/decarboxylase/D-malate dehydrogenase
MAYRIAVIPGDNVGPEVMKEGVKVLKKAEELGFGSYELTHFPWGAKYYLQTGEVMPKDGLETLKQFDAIYFGSHGDPGRVPEHITGEGLLVNMRKAFDLGVNLRPSRLLRGLTSPLRDKQEIDLVVVRENTEGEYSDIGGRVHVGTLDEVAIQVTVLTRKGSERVMRFAFELARRRNGKKKVSCCSKSSALGHTMAFWDKLFIDVAKDYPDVQTEKIHIDAFTMHLIARPESFDVIVGTNMHGDILSDEGAMITGGIGIAPSANINPEGSRPALFEPIHGSAPDIAGKGIANPIATILAGQMMMDWLGEVEGARLVMRAVEDVVAEGKVRTFDLGGKSSTTELTDAICARMEVLAR